MASKSEILKILRPLVLENYDEEEWKFIKGEGEGPGGKDRLESIGMDLFGLTDYSRKKSGGQIIKRQSGGQIGKPRGWGKARHGNK
jgi:hypothetical protein